MEGAGGGVALLSEHTEAQGAEKAEANGKTAKSAKTARNSKYQTINRATNLRQDKNSAAVR